MALAMMKPQVMKLTSTMSVLMNKLMLASRTFKLGTAGLLSSVKPMRWSTALDHMSQILCHIQLRFLPASERCERNEGLCRVPKGLMGRMVCSRNMRANALLPVLVECLMILAMCI